MKIEKSSQGNPDLSNEFKKFKEREGFTYALGVIGGSDIGELSRYEKILVEGCRIAQASVGNFAIVSGGTSGGVPELALNVGRELGLPTIGVFPQEGSKYAVTNKIDFAIAVPNQPISQIKWGIETPTLVSIPNAFLLIGGEWGTLAEVSMIMKRNSSLTRNGLQPVPIISIAGSGKIADSLEKIMQTIPTSQESYIRVDGSKHLAEALIQTFR